MPPQSPSLPPVQSNDHDYQFIMSPPAAAKGPRLPLPGGSFRTKLLYGAGGLLILIILISIIKGLVGGSGNFNDFITVAEDQQSLIHLSTAATQQQDIDTTNQNFAITAQLSLTSAQQQLLTYLKNNHQSVSNKTLGLKISSSLDSQLQTAAGNSTYDATFQQIMSNQLNTYQQALKAAYTTAGSKGKTLLNSDYHSAQLLITQLGSTSP